MNLDTLKKEFVVTPTDFLYKIAQEDYAINNPKSFTKKELIDKMIGIEFMNMCK